MHHPPVACWACVICFHPDIPALSALLQGLAGQVARVIVIDNSPGNPALDASALHGALHVPMPRNAGTAGGLNEAWARALAEGATHLVSFDQDSVPEPHLVQGLLDELAVSSATQPLAAIGPLWIDARSGKSMRLLRPVRFLRRHVAPPESGSVAVDHLITSGCLMSAAAYREVGPFDEALFLDYVDVEWSLRARSRGLPVAVTTRCKMSHAIGDEVVQVGELQLSLYQPARSYLHVRNHLLLWRRPWISRGWLVSDLVQVTAKQLALLVLAPKRLDRLRCIRAGLCDGLRGQGGPIPGELP